MTLSSFLGTSYCHTLKRHRHTTHLKDLFMLSMTFLKQKLNVSKSCLYLQIYLSQTTSLSSEEIKIEESVRK